MLVLLGLNIKDKISKHGINIKAFLYMRFLT